MLRILNHATLALVVSAVAIVIVPTVEAAGDPSSVQCAEETENNRKFDGMLVWKTMDDCAAALQLLNNAGGRAYTKCKGLNSGIKEDVKCGVEVTGKVGGVGIHAPGPSGNNKCFTNVYLPMLNGVATWLGKATSTEPLFGAVDNNDLATSARSNVATCNTLTETVKEFLNAIRCSNNGVRRDGAAEGQPCICNFGFSGANCERGAEAGWKADSESQPKFDGNAVLDVRNVDHSGEWRENMNTGTEYKMFADRETWAEARNICESYSTDGYTSSLVSIETVEERNWLNARINFWPAPQNGFWIGCNDLGTEGKFSWAADPDRPCNKNQPEYKDWQVGEPNDQSQEDCAVMREGGWQDWQCETAVGFVCERARTPCFGIDCSNNGRCIPMTTSSANKAKYECRCNEGYVHGPIMDCEVTQSGDVASAPIFKSIDPNDPDHVGYQNMPGRKLSWYDARTYCQEQSDDTTSVDLVAFDTKEEQDAVIKALGLQGVRFWTGCNDLESEGNAEGNFYWAGQDSYKSCTKGDESSSVYANWAEGEPNIYRENREHCTTVLGTPNGDWADWVCDNDRSRFEFVCESAFKTACFEVDCSNNGKCTPDADDPADYTCNCNPGFIGDRCENLVKSYSGDDGVTKVYMTVVGRLFGSWHEARAFCQQELPPVDNRSMDLVAFESKEEEDAVKQIFSPFFKTFWIGCNNLAFDGKKEGSFSWAGQDHTQPCVEEVDGEYSNWTCDSPGVSTSGELCAFMYEGNRDWQCHDCNGDHFQVAVVCEQSAPVDTPCDATDCFDNGCLQTSTDGTPPYCNCNEDFTGSHCEINVHSHTDSTGNLVKSYTGDDGVNKAYMTVPDKSLSWNEAREFCQQLPHDAGTAVDLVAFETQQEETNVRDMFNLFDKEFWIGCNDLVSEGNAEGSFSWAGQDPKTSCQKGEPGVYSNWADGEPNNFYAKRGGGENCTYVRTNGLWNDGLCGSRPKGFVCEQSAKTDAPCDATECSGNGCLQPSTDGTTCNCNTGYTGDQCEIPYKSDTDPTTGTVYMTVPDKSLSWNKAREFCQQLPHAAGTAVDLVAFETQQEEANVRDMFQLSEREVWIGCNDLVSEGNTEGSFSWAGQDPYKSCTNGESGVHSNWSPGEPNNYGEDEYCTWVLKNGVWIDGLCSLQKEFVCEQSAPVGACSETREMFTSKHQMEGNGWSFDWDDTALFSSTACPYDNAETYCGWKHDRGAGTMERTLEGSGTLTLKIENNFAQEGTVQVWVGGIEKAVLSSKKADVVTVAYTNGQILKVYEDHAVIWITSLTFVPVCSTTTPSTTATKDDAPCDATDCSDNGCLQPSTGGTPPYCECNADYTGDWCEILTKPYIGGPPNKVYMTVPGVTKTWENARKFCVAQSKFDYSVDLVTFSDPDEQVQVTELLSLTNQHFWIGCNDRTTEGTYVWAGQDAYKSCMPIEGGVHSNWRDGEPNNWNNEEIRPATDKEVGEDCVYTYGPGAWDDVPCTGSFLFICEQSAKNACFSVDCSGHGDCIRNGDNTGYSCTCTPGYTGEQCENSLQSTPETKTTSTTTATTTTTTTTIASTTTTPTTVQPSGKLSADATTPTAALPPTEDDGPPADSSTGPNDTADADAEPSSPTSTGLVAGIVVGVVAIIVIIIAAVICKKRKQAQGFRREQGQPATSNPAFDIANYAVPNLPSNAARGLEDQTYSIPNLPSNSATQAAYPNHDGTGAGIDAVYSDVADQNTAAPASGDVVVYNASDPNAVDYDVISPATVLEGTVVYDAAAADGQTYATVNKGGAAAAAEPAYAVVDTSRKSKVVVSDMYATVSKPPTSNAIEADAENHYDMSAPRRRTTSAGNTKTSGAAAAAAAAASGKASAENHYDMAPPRRRTASSPSAASSANTAATAARSRTGTGAGTMGKKPVPEALRCQRPTPTGGRCKNKKVGESRFCKGHTCNAEGCTETKSSSASFCATHIAGVGADIGGFSDDDDDDDLDC
eukprot:gene7707-16578_t